MEDDDVKLIWDINIQCDNVIGARRPDLILVDKKAKSCVIIDVAIPGDCRIREKEIEKIEKYQNLKKERERERERESERERERERERAEKALFAEKG